MQIQWQYGSDRQEERSPRPRAIAILKFSEQAGGCEETTRRRHGGVFFLINKESGGSLLLGLCQSELNRSFWQAISRGSKRTLPRSRHLQERHHDLLEIWEVISSCWIKTETARALLSNSQDLSTLKKMIRLEIWKGEESCPPRLWYHVNLSI